MVIPNFDISKLSLDEFKRLSPDQLKRVSPNDINKLKPVYVQSARDTIQKKLFEIENEIKIQTENLKKATRTIDKQRIQDKLNQLSDELKKFTDLLNSILLKDDKKDMLMRSIATLVIFIVFMIVFLGIYAFTKAKKLPTPTYSFLLYILFILFTPYSIFNVIPDVDSKDNIIRYVNVFLHSIVFLIICSIIEIAILTDHEFVYVINKARLGISDLYDTVYCFFDKNAKVIIQ